MTKLLLALVGVSVLAGCTLPENEKEPMPTEYREGHGLTLRQADFDAGYVKGQVDEIQECLSFVRANCGKGAKP